MRAIGHLTTVCACDLRERAWNPNTGRCETCRSRYEDPRDRPSRASDRRSTWEIVAAYVEQCQRDDTHVALGVGENVMPLVLADMRDRDVADRQLSGGPLTSANGRDHLGDAYQEMLDASVYLMNELDAHGVDLTSQLTKEAFPDKAQRWHLHDVQQLCREQIRAAIHLRAIMEERSRRVSSTEEPLS